MTLTEARIAGAIVALSMIANDWRGDHVASAAAVVEDIDNYVAALQGGEPLSEQQQGDQ